MCRDIVKLLRTDVAAFRDLNGVMNMSDGTITLHKTQSYAGRYATCVHVPHTVAPSHCTRASLSDGIITLHMYITQ